MPDLKYAILFTAVDRLSGSARRIGGQLGNMATAATRAAGRLAQLGEAMRAAGERMALSGALVSQGTERLRAMGEAVIEPAMGMADAMARLGAATGLSGEALARAREAAIKLSDTIPGLSAEQAADSFGRFYEVLGDTSAAQKAVAVQGRLGALYKMSGQQAQGLLVATRASMGLSARATGDLYAATARNFGLAGAQTQQLTMQVGRLGGLAQLTGSSAAQMFGLVVSLLAPGDNR